MTGKAQQRCLTVSFPPLALGQVKQELRALTSRHRCSPTPTLVLPVLVHLPLFISLSLLIRTSLLIPGSPLATELIPWSHPPADLAAKFEASAKILAERGLEGEALKKLTAMPGPTLGDVDKTMLGPLGLGLLTMINVELGQWLRRGMMSEKEEEAAKEEKEKKKQSSSKETGATEKFSLSPFRGNIIGNMLRTASIVFVVVSSQAPAVSSPRRASVPPSHQVRHFTPGSRRVLDHLCELHAGAKYSLCTC